MQRSAIIVHQINYICSDVTHQLYIYVDKHSELNASFAHLLSLNFERQSSLSICDTQFS